ncbi:Uncharacterised protein [Amycolatopsis camponoti]|uniref:Uncharacterized protein n=1 Tax=Amycolatopsis camponoti TaxID=2606593 RepID=A0A6I8LZI8_9PSEU|nr:Uncharacterised protein [Amycolatopsis camponoti]
MAGTSPSASTARPARAPDGYLWVDIAGHEAVTDTAGRRITIWLPGVAR